MNKIPQGAITVLMEKTDDIEIQFMIALDYLLAAFAQRLNDDEAFERVVMHIAEKWNCHRLPKNF